MKARITEACSIAVVTSLFPLSLFARAAPFIARQFASEPDEVKIISFLRQPSTAATLSRERSYAARTAAPLLYFDDGFAHNSVKYGSIALYDDSDTRVVAALSR